MYRCQACNKCSQAGEKANKVTLKTRPREYITDNGRFYGWEIVKEITVCNACRSLIA